jgi:predicted GIY-YIG superfamily endonuclease
MASPQPTKRQLGTVYLLHFSGRTATGHQHYLGWTTDIPKRLARHRAGRGAEETKKAVEEGLKLKLAQSWRGTLTDERRIKDERKAVKRGFGCLCPYCETDDDRAADLLRGMGPPELRVQHGEALADYAAADVRRSTGPT